MTKAESSTLKNFPDPYTYSDAYMTPELKEKLYDLYFRKEFPSINPQTLTKDQWHNEAQTVTDWVKLVGRELRIIEHRTTQAADLGWAGCDWCRNVGPMWFREDAALCIYCREAYDRGERKVLDLDYKKALRNWNTYFDADNTEKDRR